jgi:choline monooxygenase
MEKHYSIVQESISGQGSECYTPNFPTCSTVFPDGPGLSSFWGGGAEHVALYPNVLLGIHRCHFHAVLIQPDEPGKTSE